MQFFKNMKAEIIIKISLNVIIFLISMSICYLAVSFFTTHIDFRLWTEAERGFFLYLGTCISLLLTGCINLME